MVVCVTRVGRSTMFRKAKSISLVFICLTLALGLSGCTDPEVKEAMSAIDAIGEVTIESSEAIEAANEKYDSLDSEKKEQIENYTVLEKANDRLSEILYSELKQELDKTSKLEASFFAQRYDMKDISQAKTEAQSAIDESNSDKYLSAYRNLKSANDDLADYIDREIQSSYSKQTNDGDFPFAVEEEELAGDRIGSHYLWFFEPEAMLSSSYPTSFAAMQEFTDKPVKVIPFTDGGGYPYNYTWTQLPTTEITVKDSGGNEHKTLVNTELKLTLDTVDPLGNIELNERPMYFFRDQDDEVKLAVKSYEEKEFYVIYERR